MTDLTSLSNDQLMAAMNAAQQAQQNATMTHQTSPSSATAPSQYDPSEGGGTLQVGIPFAGLPSLDTHIPISQGINRFLAGMGRGFVHTARSAGNLVGAIPASVMRDEKAIDAPLLNTGAGKWGNIAGEAAITTPIGMSAMGGIGQLGKIGAGIAGGSVLNPAVQGAIQGAITSDPGDRLRNTGLGGLTGGTLGLLSSGAGKLAHGLTKTPEAETLLKEGISLTPGQLNPKGIANQFEQSLDSVPGAKQIIHGARDNAEQQFQAAVIRKGAAPGATIKPSENIHQMLQNAYDSYAPLYDQARGFPVTPAIVNPGANVPLATALQKAANMPGAPRSVKSQTMEFLKDQLSRLGNNPQSEDLLDIRSAIRDKARTMALKTDSAAGAASDIYDRAQGAITQSLESQLPPDALSALKSADSNYGTYKTIEKAVANAKDNLAGLTPAKLSQALASAIPKGAYARGAGGDLRDLAQAGTSVFQTVSPPTGARVATLMAGAGGLMASPHLAVPAAGVGLGLTGTEIGRRLAAGITFPQRGIQALERGVGNALPPYAADIGRNMLARSAVGAGMPVVQQLGPAALAAALMYGPFRRPATDAIAPNQ